MRAIFYGVLAILAGIILFFAGAVTAGDDEVKCGSQTMSPGDICKTTSDGGSVERTYDEQKSQNGRESVIMMIVGPVVSLGGLVLLLGTAGSRRRHRTPRGGYAPAPMHGGPPPAHYGPPPAPPAAPVAHPPAHAYPPAQPAYPPAAQPGYPVAPPPAQPGYPPPAQPYPPQPPPGGYPPYRG